MSTVRLDQSRDKQSVRSFYDSRLILNLVLFYAGWSLLRDNELSVIEALAAEIPAAESKERTSFSTDFDLNQFSFSIIF